MSTSSTSDRAPRAAWISRLRHTSVACAHAGLLQPILLPQDQAMSLLPYLTPYLLSLVLSAGVGAYCWQRRAEAGAAAYALAALSQTLWTVGYVFELLSPDLDSKLLWDNLQFACFAGWIMALLAFTLQYTGRRAPHPAWTYPLAALPLLAMVGLAFSDPIHGLVRSHTRLVPGTPFTALLYDFTMFDQIIFGYSYLVYFACLGLLLARFVYALPLYRAQTGVIFLGSLIPMASGTLTLTVLSHSPARDISPWTFALSSLVVAWGLFHYRLFDIMPVARETVIESMHDAVYVLDTHSRLVDLNPAACRQLGCRSKDLIGRTSAEVFATWPDLLAHYLGRAEARAEITVDIGSERHHIDLHIQPLRDRRGQRTGRVIVVRDITELWQHQAHLEELVRVRTAELVSANEHLRREIAERERLEAQFLQAQKLEALGQLAGGVAHDFNNLLTVILGGVEQLLDISTLGETARQDAEQVYLAARRGAALTQQLLAFSRQQVLEPRSLDLNRIVEEMGQLLRRLIGEGIELAVQPAPDLGLVYADPGRLGQVIMNLAVNARDAMPAGGTLTIKTTNVTLRDPATCAQIGVERGRYIALTVSDTGVGMDAATCAQIFEPFFTTKAAGKGTGLGLATVHGIVTQSGGHIQVHSEPGRGTAFTIYLPRVAAGQTSGADDRLVETSHGAASAPPAKDTPALLNGRRPARSGSHFLYR